MAHSVDRASSSLQYAHALPLSYCVSSPFSSSAELHFVGNSQVQCSSPESQVFTPLEHVTPVGQSLVSSTNCASYAVSNTHGWSSSNPSHSSTNTCKKRKNEIDEDCSTKEPFYSSPSLTCTSSAEDAHSTHADPLLSYMDLPFQCIRFQPFQTETWPLLLDAHLQPVAPVTLRVEADKGFNFSATDEAFVCQKKNHFQLSVQLQWSDSLNAIGAEGWLVQMSHASDEQMPGSGTLKPACAFYLDFYGVRAEVPCQRIKVEQSQADRSKRPFLPIRLAWTAESGWSGKCTVGRLHFTETTANNMRKKGKPNPEQRYFYLVVSLCAQLADGQLIPLVSHASEKIIVRASNPGQFESDADVCWQRTPGTNVDTVFHHGRVGVNTDRPDEALCVHGNLKLTGALLQPSDARLKQSIRPVDTYKSLLRMCSIKLVYFKFRRTAAQKLSVDDRIEKMGVIAQQLQQVLPQAVIECSTMPQVSKPGLLLVDKERLLMECLAAIQQLHVQQVAFEVRLQQVHKIALNAKNTYDQMRAFSKFALYFILFFAGLTVFCFA